MKRILCLLLFLVGCDTPKCTPYDGYYADAQEYKQELVIKSEQARKDIEFASEQARLDLLAQADYISRVETAKRTADGLNYLTRALAFFVILGSIWLARQFWYLERYK